MSGDDPHAHPAHPHGHRPHAAHHPHRAAKGRPWYRRPLPVGLLILAIIVVAIAATLLWKHNRDYEYTDDAFIDVRSELVSARIPGRVVRVLVDDNQDVSAGQLLVELDPADDQARLDQAKAAEAQAAAQMAQAQAQKTSFEAQVEQARASQGVAEANAHNAADDLQRYQGLKKVNAGAVSSQQLDAATAAATSSAAQVRAAQKAVSAAESQVGYAEAEMQAARAAEASARSQVREAGLTLSYAEIRARQAGRIASKTVSEGNYIAAGAALMAVVPREVFITANFKETQLKRMRPGQPAKVKIDSYPDLQLAAHVDSVQPATGQAFSVLPAENATGNWVKVVQRVPVKIVFDQIPSDPVRRLGPGMSVEVTVSVR